LNKYDNAGTKSEYEDAKHFVNFWLSS